MRRSFSYRDAVKLLGGDTGLVKLVDHASAAAVLATGGINLLDARTEVVRVGKQVLSSVRERVSGLHRVDRTRLLEAAHSILVVTSFFEALDDVGLPFEIRLSRDEQLVLAGGGPVPQRKAGVVVALLDTAIPLPSAEQPPDVVTNDLADFYRNTVAKLLDFVSGFEAWGDLPMRRRDEFAVDAQGVPTRAVALYRARYRQLAVDCPEFSVWTSGIEHAATRAEVRTALEDMRGLLTQLAGAQPPDDRRDALARGYRRSWTGRSSTARSRPGWSCRR